MKVGGVNRCVFFKTYFNVLPMQMVLRMCSGKRADSAMMDGFLQGVSQSASHYI